MNLSEALDAALPEIPQARLKRSRPPRLDPELIVREMVEGGEPVIGVMQRDKMKFFRFTPRQWQFISLFDGVRSYQEIADLYSEQTAQLLSALEAREFADSMEEFAFWYKTPQEKNLALNEKLVAERSRRAGRASKFNVAHIRFSAWDPDRYFNWLDGAIGEFIYSRWCILSMLLLFLFETVVFINHWNVIGPDAKLYYNFTQKSLLDVLQFWLLFLFLGFIHESAHGLSCKHFGGQVHSMGLMFLYLLPAFYVDVTEIWVYATKLQRLATIIAGIWSETVVCGFGVILWLSTSEGTWLHNLAYQVMLITGLFAIIINLNPLIKLDGYYFLTEAIGMPDLKERSTAFLTAWFQSGVLQLKVETPAVPRRHVMLYTLYALASGAYSYLILIFVIRLSYNVLSHWLAEFALIPAAALAFTIFRGRLRSLRGVVLRFWKEHFELIHGLRPIHFIPAVVLAALLLVPFWRDREDAYFVVEPTQSETLHAAVPGRVKKVLVHEGEQVRAGEPMLTMTSLMAASMLDSAGAQTRSVSYRAFNSELQGQSIGPAAAEQSGSERYTRIATEAQMSLVVTAPTNAIVLTEDPSSLLGQQVGSGQPLLDLADDGPRAVRVYIPAAALERIPASADVALELPGRFSPVHLALAQPGGEVKDLPLGLVAKQAYKGIKLPTFYSARMILPSSAGLPRFGEAGRAKIFGVRRSVAGHIFIAVANLARAHIWW